MKTSVIKFISMLSFSAMVVGAAEPKTTRAVLLPPAERKMAPTFRLPAASGKEVRSQSYRKKVVLLNFWATECGGCVAEIPYFVELDQAYRSKGLAVVGVSLDIMYEDLKNADEGWHRVKPFAQKHNVNYSVLMGDDPVSKVYDIQAMPATYLIDKRGRIAAIYIGVVDKNDVASNIKALLRE
jgi:peroxiredoxin